MSWRFGSDDFPLQMGVFLGSKCRDVSALRGTGEKQSSSWIPAGPVWLGTRGSRDNGNFLKQQEKRL